MKETRAMEVEQKEPCCLEMAPTQIFRHVENGRLASVKRSP